MTIAGPPMQIAPHDVLSYSLPEVIALYLHTIDWERRQQAQHLEEMASTMQRHAALQGAKPIAAREFVSGLFSSARELRRPMFDVERPEIPEERQAFFRPALAKEENA